VCPLEHFILKSPAANTSFKKPGVQNATADKSSQGQFAGITQRGGGGKEVLKMPLHVHAEFFLTFLQHYKCSSSAAVKVQWKLL
jgi:hypothetical protein